jgi:hypothetical protein
VRGRDRVGEFVCVCVCVCSNFLCVWGFGVVVGSQQLGSLVHGSHDNVAGVGGMVRHSLTFGKEIY